MDGAEEGETRARELVRKLGAPDVSPWTVAELLALGDRAVVPLEDFAGRSSPAAVDRRKLAALILEAIGTPAARAAARRSGAATGTEAGGCDGAA